MKAFDSSLITELGAGSFVYAELVEFQTATPLYLTTASFDITTSTLTSSGSQTYLAQGKFMGYSGVKQVDELRINTVTIELSGSTSTFVNLVLQDQYLHKKIQIYRVWLNSSTGAIIAIPALIYAGTMTGGEVTDTATECSVSIVTANEFYDFDKTSGRRTNENSQQRFYSGDRGMQYSTTTIGDIRWGKPSN
jgi:hypothetical protein